MGKKWLLPLLGLVLVGWSTWNVIRAQGARGGGAPSQTGPQAPYPNSVSGNGVVEPFADASGTAKVAVGPEVAGLVVEVYQKARRAFVSGQTVPKGEPLFRLDDTAWRGDLKVKEAA